MDGRAETQGSIFLLFEGIQVQAANTFTACRGLIMSTFWEFEKVVTVTGISN